MSDNEKNRYGIWSKVGHYHRIKDNIMRYTKWSKMNKKWSKMNNKPNQFSIYADEQKVLKENYLRENPEIPIFLEMVKIDEKRNWIRDEIDKLYLELLELGVAEKQYQHLYTEKMKEKKRNLIRDEIDNLHLKVLLLDKIYEKKFFLYGEITGDFSF